MNYIQRTETGVCQYTTKQTNYRQGLKQRINELCLTNLSTFEGRSKAAQKILETNVLLPIYINEELLLFPTESIRNLTCKYINYFQVLSITNIAKNKSRINFNDLSTLELDLSYKKLCNQIKKIEILLQYKQQI